MSNNLLSFDKWFKAIFQLSNNSYIFCEFQRVDSKALEKAEKVLAKKNAQKESSPATNTNRYRNNEATASQVLSKKAESGNALLTKDIKIEVIKVIVSCNHSCPR